MNQQVLGSLLPSTTTHLLYFSPLIIYFREGLKCSMKECVTRTAGRGKGHLSSSLFLSLPAQGFVNPFPALLPAG